MNMFTAAIVFPVSAYLIGSVPFGLLIVRASARIDIRTIGSGNIGATNVRRAAGTKWAIVALTCDVLKGLLPILAAVYAGTTSSYQWLPAITALAAVCGHMFPLYLGFKPSGKGVATALGALLIPLPWACLWAVAAFIIAVAISRRISAGSLTGAFILPPAAWFSSRDPYLALAALLIMILILSRHKENIQRLAARREPALGKRLKQQVPPALPRHADQTRHDTSKSL